MQLPPPHHPHPPPTHTPLYRSPTEDELHSFGAPDFTIYNGGAFPANRYTSYMTSSTSIDVSLKHKEMVGKGQGWGPGALLQGMLHTQRTQRHAPADMCPPLYHCLSAASAWSPGHPYGLPNRRPRLSSAINHINPITLCLCPFRRSSWARSTQAR